MFDQFLNALKLGKAKKVQDRLFYDGLQELHADDSVLELPDSLPQSITETDWYKRGGWKAVRRAAYGSWEKQMELQFDGVWNEHVEKVKALFLKPG